MTDRQLVHYMHPFWARKAGQTGPSVADEVSGKAVVVVFPLGRVLRTKDDESHWTFTPLGVRAGDDRRL